MVLRIITGGQTGVDQAAWRGARLAGMPTGGLMPRGFATEDGPRPDFAAIYGAEESASADPAVRTAANVAAADATLILIAGPVGFGTALTLAECCRHGRPNRIVELGRPEAPDSPAAVADWVREQGCHTLNIAGDRESTRPGIGRLAEAFVRALLAELGPPDA